MLTAYARRHPWVIAWFACLSILAAIAVLSDLVPDLSPWLFTIPIFWLSIGLLGIWTALGTPRLFRQPWISVIPPQSAQRTWYTIAGEGLACFLIAVGLSGSMRSWPPLMPFAVPLALPLGAVGSGSMVICIVSLFGAEIAGRMQRRSSAPDDV